MKKNITEVRMMYLKNGGGYDNTRIPIPITWARQMGFSRENRSCVLKLENKKITITKK